MQGSRISAENLPKQRLKISLDNQMFNFVNKLQVGDKKNMDIIAKFVSERKTEDGGIVHRIRIIDAKLNKLARLA